MGFLLRYLVFLLYQKGRDSISWWSVAITPDVKQMGARNAGNPHAACDVERAGNVARSGCLAEIQAWDKLIVALETGGSWHDVSRKTRIPYSTVKKHARALGFEPQSRPGTR